MVEILLGYIRLGARIALRRRRIAASAALSIMISVALLYSSASVLLLLQQKTSEYLRNTGSRADLSVSSTKWSNPITSAMESEIASLPHVTNTIRRIEESAQVSNGSNWIHLMLVSMDFTSEQSLGDFVVTMGELPEKSGACFLTETAAALLNKSVGDEIGLYTSAGIHFFRISGYGHAVDKGLFGPIVFISLEDGWDIYTIRYPNKSTNRLIVQVDGVFQINSVLDSIDFLYGDDYITTNEKAYGLWVAMTFLYEASSFLSIVTVIAFVIASLRIFSSYMLAFVERRYEMGLFLAFGCRRSQLFTVLMTEIMVVGLLGGVLGIALGVVGSLLTSQLATVIFTLQSSVNVGQLIGPSFVVDVSTMCISFLVGLTITVLVGIIPAILASRYSLIDSLRYAVSGVAVPPTIPSSIRKWARRALLVISLALASLTSIQVTSDIFGLHILQNDTLRVLSLPTMILLVASFSDVLSTNSTLIKIVSKRFSAPVRKLITTGIKRKSIASMLAFNLFLAVTAMFFVSVSVSSVVSDSWQRTMSWHSYQTNVVAFVDDAVDPGFVSVIEDSGNITSFTTMATSYEVLSHAGSAETGLVFGVDPSSFQNLASIGLLDSTNMSAGFGVLNPQNTCIISEFAADSLRVGIGDIVSVDSGVDLTVVAICESSTPVFMFTFISPFFIIIDSRIWESVTSRAFRPQGVLLHSPSPEDAIAELTSIPGVYPIQTSQIEADYESALEALRLLLDIAIGSMLIVASIGAIITGWSNANTRRREIGMLRALGMRRREVASVVGLESSIPMLLGTMWGLALGLFMYFPVVSLLANIMPEPTDGIGPLSIALVFLSLTISVYVSYVSANYSSRGAIIDLLSDRQRGQSS